MKYQGRLSTQTIAITNRIKIVLSQVEILRVLMVPLLNSHLRLRNYIDSRKKIIMSQFTPKRKITMRLNKLEIKSIAKLNHHYKKRKVLFHISLFCKIHNMKNTMKRMVKNKIRRI